MAYNVIVLPMLLLGGLFNCYVAIQSLCCLFCLMWPILSLCDLYSLCMVYTVVVYVHCCYVAYAVTMYPIQSLCGLYSCYVDHNFVMWPILLLCVTFKVIVWPILSLCGPYGRC